VKKVKVKSTPILSRHKISVTKAELEGSNLAQESEQ